MKTSTILFTISALFLTALSTSAAEPLEVNASDLIGKVYCVADPKGSPEACREAATGRFAAPEAESGAEWLTATDGFLISYDGMQPEAEAMARYDHGAVAGYGYIFYFPYASAGREDANSHQCRFCSALLDELVNNGVVLGADPMTADLFDVAGVFPGGDLRLTLSEHVEAETVADDLPAGAVPADRSGEFILLVNIVPAAYTASLSE